MTVSYGNATQRLNEPIFASTTAALFVSSHQAPARSHPACASPCVSLRSSLYGRCDASLTAPRTLRRPHRLQTLWECPECKHRFLWPRCYVSDALSRDGYKRSKARPRVLLLCHLSAPVGAPENVEAHAMSA